MVTFTPVKLANGSVYHLNLEQVRYLRANPDGTTTIVFEKDHVLTVATSTNYILKSSI